MKIIKAPGPWSYEYTCVGCNADLEVEPSDVKQGRFGACYGGDIGDLRFYVECPVCQVAHCIDDSKIRQDVQNGVKRCLV